MNKTRQQPHEEQNRLSQYLIHRRKLRLERPISWDHHRGGWRQVVGLISEHLHCPDGIQFISAVDEFLVSQKILREPWVGFIHGVPKSPYLFPDLDRLMRTDVWLANIYRCQGLWVLSDYIKQYLLDSGVPCPVNRVYYPTDRAVPSFQFPRFADSRPRKILSVGEFLRVYDAFYELEAPGYEKLLLRCIPTDWRQRKLQDSETVRVLDRVDNEAYDALMTESIIFLNLLDAPANTTIVECIARGTPVLVNRVGSITEYLGRDYPFYYDTLDEAAEKLQDLDLIARTFNYLRWWNRLRGDLTFPYFLYALQNTAIYRNLPVPRSQRRQFQFYDLTVVMCAYGRVEYLEELLTRFCRQDFEGDFEIILWNNNLDIATRVQAIADTFQDRLNLKVIHSSENFYCIIRLAVASLMRSDLLMICDDDVQPAPGYLSTFVQKYSEYGPDAVLCARGNVFLPHALNEEEPERAWKHSENILFFDEHGEDCQVHFIHADNCLIPKHLLRQILQFDMEHYEYALIDDYWMSYVISHELNIPIWKIKADQALSFTESASDPEVALYHNNQVSEQRINFYVHHMRAHWPTPPPDPPAGPDEVSKEQEAPGAEAEDAALLIDPTTPVTHNGS